MGRLALAIGMPCGTRWFQPLALFAANSIFVEGYLTTPGQNHSAAHEMVERMGFSVEEAPAALEATVL